MTQPDRTDMPSPGFSGAERSERSTPRPSIAWLLEGLMRDVKTLVLQEVTLAQDEIARELTKAKTAAVSLAIGVGLAAVGGLLLVIMLVHGLNALTRLPLWACYGIVGGVLVGAALVLLRKAGSTAGDIHMVPRHTVRTIKENVTWLKEHAVSRKT